MRSGPSTSSWPSAVTSVSTDAVVELLGAVDAELLFEVTDAIAAGDAKAAFEAVERLSRWVAIPASSPAT